MRKLFVLISLFVAGCATPGPGDYMAKHPELWQPKYELYSYVDKFDGYKIERPIGNKLYGCDGLGRITLAPLSTPV